MGKYDPLREYLEACGQPLARPSFAEIERILGDALPRSPAPFALGMTGTLNAL